MPLSEFDLQLLELRAGAGEAVSSVEVLHLIAAVRSMRAEVDAAVAADVLLVEDNNADLELSLRALRRYHLSNHLHIARDGEEALEFIFAESADEGRSVGSALGLVLLDLRMPKVDGFEVLRAMKADPRTKNIPVVVLTAFSDGPDIAESKRRGADGYMIKPVDFPKLVETVRLLGFHWSLYDGAVTVMPSIASQ